MFGMSPTAAGFELLKTRVWVHAVRESRPVPATERTAAVGVHFGLPPAGATAFHLGPLRVPVGPGRIVFLTGPSGCGKSTALEQVARTFAGAILVHRIPFPADAAVIDAVAPWAPWDETVRILTGCGLGDPQLWLRRFDELSEGERFRARLARGLAFHLRSGSSAPLICDEFCSLLHRRAAKATAFMLRKTVTRRRLCVVAASAHEDILPDLRPDAVLRLGGTNGCAGLRNSTRRLEGRLSLLRRLRIEHGSKRDYEALAAMHYRATDELGFVDKVFIMRDPAEGDVVGIVVYAHPPIELSLRNSATKGRFVRNPARLNREVRILRRLVIHPDLRGCGLGHDLVRKTLTRVGTPFVECLAAMGEFNPVFEKAGMTRIGQCEIPPECQAVLAELRALDADPNGADFAARVCTDRRVRVIVARVVRDWYAATTGEGRFRVERQSPPRLALTFRGLMTSRPVYYLWRAKKRAAHRSSRRQDPR
jgi:GNAT superfamily N-acetyltransferase